MKILIYGFKPFGKYKENISEKIVKNLDKRKFKRIVLPVNFDSKIIINYIKKTKPDIVIGLGLLGKGRFVRIERKAKNIYKDKKNPTKKEIKRTGPNQYLVNLKIKKTTDTKISYNAGEYICNFTMYIVMDWIYENKSPIKFGFIHIPYNLEFKRAIKIIKKLI